MWTLEPTSNLAVYRQLSRGKPYHPRGRCLTLKVSV